MSDFHMVLNLTKLGIRDKYMGSALGSFWAIVSPLSLLALYTFVFGFVLRLRAPGAETTFTYAIWLIAGMGPWIAISEAISSATQSVVGGSSLVKNLAFKTELLTVASVLTTVVTLAVSLIFLIGLILVDGAGLSWHLLWIPVVVIIQYVFLVGLGLVFATINVFFRDFGVALQNLLMVILFATPIFYSISEMPAILQKVSIYNPFYILVMAYRSVIVEHSSPDVLSIAYLAAIAFGFFVGGLAFFRKFKGYFEGFL